MTMRRLMLVCLIVCGIVGSGSLVWAADVPADDDIPLLSRQQIERIVRDYLLREPDILFQAAKIYEERRKARPVAEIRQAIIGARAALTDTKAPSIGATTPKLTLVEFYDFRCIYCRRMAPLLDQVVRENPDIRLVFKDLPILGPDSRTAAQAALAARRQHPDRYHALQQALIQSNDLSETRIIGIADALGFDTEKLRRDMAGPEVKAELDANIALAKSLGIAGTPAFVIGDTLVPTSMAKPELVQRIEKARKSCGEVC